MGRKQERSGRRSNPSLISPLLASKTQISSRYLPFHIPFMFLRCYWRIISANHSRPFLFFTVGFMLSLFFFLVEMGRFYWNFSIFSGTRLNYLIFQGGKVQASSISVRWSWFRFVDWCLLIKWTKLYHKISNGFVRIWLSSGLSLELVHFIIRWMIICSYIEAMFW